MNADEIARQNQKIAYRSTFVGRGSLETIFDHELNKPTAEYIGRGPFYIVNQIKNAVEQARFQGRDLSIWVSSGWFSKKFVVKGNAGHVASLERWVSECFGREE